MKYKLLCGLGLSLSLMLYGCTPEVMTGLDFGRLPEGLVQDDRAIIEAQAEDFDRTPEEIIAAIEAARAGRKAGMLEDVGLDALTADGDLAGILRQNGMDETAIQDVMARMGKTFDGRIPFPGMGVIKSIWAANGVSIEAMHRNYDDMVQSFAKLGINLDIANFDTGFGTVEELCEAILGDMGSIPELLHDGTGMNLGPLPGMTQ